MVTNRRTKVIALSDLKPGMFVVKLDIPWIDSPFMKHTRMIKGPSDISKLEKAGVKKLVIDIERGLKPDTAQVSVSEEDLSEGEETDSDSDKETKALEQGAKEASDDNPAPKAEFATEIKRAFNIRTQIKNTVSKLNAKLEHGHPVDQALLQPLIDETVDSLERNNQALLNLVHICGKSQKLVDHAFSTFCLALNVAITMGLSEEDRAALGTASLLHDSGWLQLPLHLMGKRAPYSPVELKLVHSHVDTGLKILKSSELPELVYRIVDEHHELLDGSGYPKKHKAEDTHFLSKLLSVVDYYDESIHQLLDKPGMQPTNVLRILFKQAEEGKYEKDVVAALINILGVYPVTSAVELSSGEKAVVEQVFANAHLQPVVRILYGKDGKLLPTPEVVDLSAESETRKIERLLEPGNRKDDPDNRLYAQFD